LRSKFKHSWGREKSLGKAGKIKNLGRSSLIFYRSAMGKINSPRGFAVNMGAVFLEEGL
jgi:hypothetical protein